MKTSEISEHFTPLDRSILEGDGAYDEYFKYMSHALNSLLESYDLYKSDNPYELKIIKKFSQKLLNTIECFKIKYSINENNLMLLDLTESSFPNHMEFRKLNDDLAQKRKKQNEGQSSETLRHMILDDLIENKKDPKNLLKQLSQKSYFEKISKSSLFQEFTPGELKELDHSKDPKNRRFLYSWGSFDSVTNRPYIYILVMDVLVESREDSLMVEKTKFKENIKKITHNTAPLKVIISDLDQMYNSIRPQVLKRINLGPVFGKYSKDKNEFTQLLKDNFNKDEFILTYETEVIFSVGEKKNKSFLSSGELRQIFYVDDSNKDCMERMISKLHKYMITSHGVMQYLTEYHKDKLDELSSKPYIY